jgi:two-component system response regulator GlrR
MVTLRQQIGMFAAQQSSVIISGETGSGKELVARSLHALSERRNAAFVAINCGAVPAELIESELFGHVRGAFTNAHADRPGLLVQANHGTLFLDEIGDMPLAAQVKLLRALQEREVRAVGSDTVRNIDVRVIAATHVDLQKAIDAKRFRQDLYYRLNVLSISVPPLRERREDIPALAELFLRRHASAGRALKLSPRALDRLVASSWPGNVRQLDNAIQRACALCTGDEILPEHLPDDIDRAVDTIGEALREAVRKARASGTLTAGKVGTLREERQELILTFTRDYLRRVLRLAGGVVAEAARIAGLDRANFRKLLRKYGIDPKDFRNATTPAAGGDDASDDGAALDAEEDVVGSADEDDN